MKQRLSLAILAACLVAPAIAADSYSIDPRHFFPSFEVNHLGFSTQRGRFEKGSGKIMLDAAGKKGSIEVSIEAASIDMGFEDWNKHMRSEDFFNVDKHPTLSFKSSKLMFDGDKVVGAEGDLTMLGVTKPVKLSVANFRCGDHPRLKKPMCGADVTAAIKRSDFGMKYGLPGVGDDIRMLIPIEAFKD